jgi:hypothetical protein
VRLLGRNEKSSPKISIGDVGKWDGNSGMDEALLHAAIDQFFDSDSGPRFDLLLPAVGGLDVAVERIVPPNPVRVAPVFILNYGDSADIDIPDGLNVALGHYPTDPSLSLSPIFFGLASALPPVVDG